MMTVAPSLDSLATVRAKLPSEIRALECEEQTLVDRLAEVRADLAVRRAVRDAVQPKPDITTAEPLTISRRNAR